MKLKEVARALAGGSGLYLVTADGVIPDGALGWGKLTIKGPFGVKLTLIAVISISWSNGVGISIWNGEDSGVTSPLLTLGVKDGPARILTECRRQAAAG